MYIILVYHPKDCIQVSFAVDEYESKSEMYAL